MAPVYLRDSRFELLRIISMLLIVVLHLIIYDQRIPSYKSIDLECLHYFSGCGVSLFAILSGYFGIKPSWKKIYTLWFQTRFYFIVGILVSAFFMHDFHMPYYRCFGFANVGYWYVVSYIILSIVILLFGDLPNDRSKLKKGVFVLFLYLYIGQWLNHQLGTEFALLLFCYVLGKCMRLDIIKVPLKITLPIVCGGGILYIITSNNLIPFSDSIFKLMNTNYCPFTIVTAIFIFEIFRIIPRFSSAFVNDLARASLPVYLITEVDSVCEFVHHCMLRFPFTLLTIIIFAFGSYVACYVLFKILGNTCSGLSNYSYKYLSNLITKVV